MGSANTYSPSQSFSNVRETTKPTLAASSIPKSPQTLYSSQRTESPSVITSSDIPEPTSLSPVQTDAPTGFNLGHGLFIIIPVLLGVTFIILVCLILWRKYYRKSFDKFVRRLPLSETWTRLSATRAKNRKTRQMVRGTYTGDKDGFGDVLYSRKMRKHTAEAEKAAMKQDLNLTSPGLSTKKASKKASRTWRDTKSTTTTSSTTSSKPPDRGHATSASLASMESWEEKWHALGNETRLIPADNLRMPFHALSPQRTDNSQGTGPQSEPASALDQTFQQRP